MGWGAEKGIEQAIQNNNFYRQSFWIADYLTSMGIIRKKLLCLLLPGLSFFLHQPWIDLDSSSVYFLGQDFSHMASGFDRCDHLDFGCRDRLQRFT